MAIAKIVTPTPNPLLGISWDAPADLSNRKVQERLSPDAIRTFLKIAEFWELGSEDARNLLGGISNGAYYELRDAEKGKLMDQDKLTRISLLIGIFKALRILYSTKLADAWIGLPNTNTIFGGDTPLAYMVRGGMPAILRVRQLLDARRGGR